MKYKEQIDKLLRESFFDPTWMTEDDYIEFLSLINISYQEWDNAIDVGINNGYSLEFQLRLLRDLVKSGVV